MTTNLFLDDERPCPAGFTHVKSYTSCVAFMILFPIHILSLDHDLGTEKTGYDVMCWLEEAKHNEPAFQLPKKIIIHSANPVGRENMQRVIDRLYGNENR